MQIFARTAEYFHRHPVLFSVLWGGVFTLFFTGFFQRGLVPPLFRDDAANNNGPNVTLVSGPIVEASETRGEALPIDAVALDAPIRVASDAVALDVSVSNPTERNIGALDGALQLGAVHYPGSGDLEDTSNMFIFGHSTNWPVVRNQAYKAFNNLSELVRGDVVTVYSDTVAYDYRVASVSLVDADTAWVQFESSTKKLTLSTCNTFGEKQERYVVEADFIGKRSL